MNPNIAVVALGSNLGDSPRLLTEAMARLETCSTHPLVRASLWRTTPVDCPPGSPYFVNTVVILVPLPGEKPDTLLVKLQKMEVEFGRQPKLVQNEARPLDLDLILFGPEILRTEKLTLPHPRAHQRKFVLQPLSEIAPDLIIPGINKPVSELLAALPLGENVTRI